MTRKTDIRASGPAQVSNEPAGSDAHIVLSHNGVCVSDMERSLRFYGDALGFELHQRHEIAEAYGRLAELPDLKAQIAFLVLGGRMLELIHFEHPLAFGPTARRAMNQYGLTHLCFKVSDIDAVAARIAKAGGKALPETRVHASGHMTMYCTDPDGVRIELTCVSP